VKFCVTGGSGFIGSYFCRTLRQAGHEIVIVDLIPPPPPAKTPHDRFIQGDIRDLATMNAALAGCDAVVHLAAAHHDFGIAYDTYFSVNEHGSEVICQAMDNQGVRNVCFYSTVAVYGEAPEPHHEHSPCKPDSPYGASKLSGERIFQKWTERGGGRRCLVIRPTVTFGPHNFANMYSLIRQIYRRRFVQVGPGRNIKSLSYVENIVAATMYLWNKKDIAAFDVYNFIDKPDMTSRQISEAIYEALGRRFPTLRVPMWCARAAALPFDALIAVTGKNLPVSGARIKKLFTTQTKFEADKIAASGFHTDISLREGIRRMVKWYVDEGQYESAEWHQPPAHVVRMTAD
jgi:nucleoside-diphosphate-sugar epimerase